MIRELNDLIMDYVYEMRELEQLLAYYQQRYYYLDVELETLDDLTAFTKVMHYDLPGIRLLRCIGDGCTECEHHRNGVWTYVDVGMSIGHIVHFFEHLRSDGLICHHEVMSSITCSRHVAYIKLKVRDG